MFIGMPALIFTGWGLLYPEYTVDQVMGKSGLLLTDIVHITFGFFVTIFLIIHVYFASIGLQEHNHFKAMFKGKT
ncbi:MAG: hypothetical protein HC896_04520 [Bacteroidales bacterium]|nr:hypothetical protein [Bacteroidales bacterium]